MARLACIKGSVISELVEDIRKLHSDGTIDDALLDARLQPEDVAMLGQTVVPSQWYDIGFYTRLTELLRDTLGDGTSDFVRLRGRAKGERLIEAGLYQQMEYARRAEAVDQLDPAQRFQAYGRDLRLMVTLGGSILNFGTWTVEPDPKHAHRYQVVVSDAADFPDVLGWSSLGLIESMSAQHAMTSALWLYERPRFDRVLFRMTQDV